LPVGKLALHQEAKPLSDEGEERGASEGTLPSKDEQTEVLSSPQSAKHDLA